ncbi:Olfactory receptor 7C1 [Heterocephalus glaber]|uniref:Olfactory receptor 7C1 n=1 Tax=Heterocephalus glaber TaxID=10181 RepID=G5BYR5_HETGA|nr:Olfactory receptor 7C1 [Heterocephalus glaber]
MKVENHTEVAQFFLLGLSDDPELQPLLFELFLSMYLVTVLGNLFIILAVSSDVHLHTPMYFFLSNLSFVDICFTSTTVPKMLVNIQAQNKDDPELQPLLFELFLSMYLVTVLGNLFIILAVSSDVHLHTPMYFFLSNLSFVDICFTSTTVPKMLVNIQAQNKGLGVYLSSPGTHSSRESSVASVMYIVVTPMLNPFIYSLRNKDVKGGLRRLLSRVAHGSLGTTDLRTKGMYKP